MSTKANVCANSLRGSHSTVKSGGVRMLALGRDHLFWRAVQIPELRDVLNVGVCMIGMHACAQAETF